MPHELEITLLGYPTIIYRGEAIRFATSKTLALLIYLVVEGGLQPRTKLATMFWPDSDEASAQASLRNAIARIRRALPGLDPLVTEASSIAYNAALPPALDLDLALRAAADAGSEAVEPPTLALLQQVVCMARGPFLDSFSLPNAPGFDQFVQQQTLLWEHRLNLVFDCLTRHQLDAHELRTGIETANRWLALDPLNERPYLRLMHFYYLDGDRAAALHVYQMAHEMLQQHMNQAPSAKMEELRALIEDGPAPAVCLLPMPDQTLRSPAVPFVGRASELARIVTAWRRAAAGEPQLVILAGDEGSGKTRLAGQLMRWAQLHGADVLYGTAWEQNGRLLYQSIVDALRVRLERENAPEDLLEDTWLAKLARLLPELRTRYPDLLVEPSDTLAASLYEAVTRLSLALAAKRPLLWVMDDSHWADTESRQLLRYLLMRWREERCSVLLLLVVEDMSLSSDPDLHRWLHSMEHDMDTMRLTLGNLSLAELEDLVEGLGQGAQKDAAALADWLWRQTAGVPANLAALLIDLQSRNQLMWSDGQPQAVLNVAATLAHIAAEQKLIDVIPHRH